MIDIMILLCLTGLTVAGLWDLFTTEVPDEIPVMMVFLGIFFWYFSALSTGDFLPLFYSLTIGTVLLIIGLVLYKLGKWGGADAWLLAAVAYLIPLYSGIFVFSFIINLILVGSAYIIIYAIILGIKNRKVLPIFIKDLKRNIKIVAAIPLLFSCFIIASLFVGVTNILPLINILVLITLLTLFWRYALVIENKVFKKRIPSSKLKVGDVLEDMIWRGLTEDEIKKIRKNKRFVVIKEGVRFVPAYAITFVVSLFYGNLIFLFI